MKWFLSQDDKQQPRLAKACTPFGPFFRSFITSITTDDVLKSFWELKMPNHASKFPKETITEITTYGYMNHIGILKT